MVSGVGDGEWSGGWGVEWGMVSGVRDGEWSGGR